MIVYFADTAEQLRDALVDDMIQRVNSAAARTVALEKKRAKNKASVTLRQLNSAINEYNTLARELETLRTFTIRSVKDNPFRNRIEEKS